MSSLIPSLSAMSIQLARFASSCSACEVVLFEKTTLLVIDKYTRVGMEDEMGWEKNGRFEKMCQSMKMFKHGAS